MYEVQRYGSRAVSPRDQRRVSRSTSGMAAGVQIRQSQTDMETDVAIGKIENATMATGSGMHAVMTVAQAQQALEQLAPAASGRLALIADGHALDVADTLADLRRRLRRI